MALTLNRRSTAPQPVIPRLASSPVQSFELPASLSQQFGRLPSLTSSLVADKDPYSPLDTPTTVRFPFRPTATCSHPRAGSVSSTDLIQPTQAPPAVQPRNPLRPQTRPPPRRRNKDPVPRHSSRRSPSAIANQIGLTLQRHPAQRRPQDPGHPFCAYLQHSLADKSPHLVTPSEAHPSHRNHVVRSVTRVLGFSSS